MKNQKPRKVENHTYGSDCQLRRLLLRVEHWQVGLDRGLDMHWLHTGLEAHLFPPNNKKLPKKKEKNSEKKKGGSSEREMCSGVWSQAHSEGGEWGGGLGGWAGGGGGRGVAEAEVAVAAQNGSHVVDFLLLPLLRRGGRGGGGGGGTGCSCLPRMPMAEPRSTSRLAATVRLVFLLGHVG